MKNKEFVFKKDPIKGWYNANNGYYLGTDDNCDIYNSLLEDGWTLNEIIDVVMDHVNLSLIED